MKSKFTIGATNTAYHTHSLYVLLTVMELFNTIFFVSFLMITTTTQVKFEIQTILVHYLKENLPIVDKIYFFNDFAERYKNCKNFINLCHNQ